MSDKLYALALDGDLEALCGSVYEQAEEDPEMEVYQWLQVASSLGCEEAEEMSDDIYEAALSRGGDETVAVLHFEVAEWFIKGENGVAPNPELGLEQLRRAEDFQLFHSVDLGGGLEALRESLSAEHQKRLAEIFPDLK